MRLRFVLFSLCGLAVCVLHGEPPEDVSVGDAADGLLAEPSHADSTDFLLNASVNSPATQLGTSSRFAYDTHLTHPLPQHADSTDVAMMLSPINRVWADSSDFHLSVRGNTIRSPHTKFIHPVGPDWYVGGFHFGDDWDICHRTPGQEGRTKSCDPYGPRWPRHTGADMHAPAGTPVLAAGAGKVVYWKRELPDGWGGLVVIEHDLDGNPSTTDDRITTLYMHVIPDSSIDPAIKTSAIEGYPNTNISQPGIEIASVQDISVDGHAPHLHFGYRKAPFNKEAYSFEKSFKARVGALPPECANCPASCDTKGGFNLPAFPEYWHDPAELFGEPVAHISMRQCP